ncbi:hypothetical protein RJ640_026930 [Escallonia rubra]|uniref:Protein kinase domain-containing protein n=1 Tax=Escallonia rubra TaxID=112253 RepID=A0AA88QYB1_9ASTE|nr:hypothetical protein RJ640_026930 [Escallonia rubra]
MEKHNAMPLEEEVRIKQRRQMATTVLYMDSRVIFIYPSQTPSPMGLSSPIKSRSLPNSILCQAHEELGEELKVATRNFRQDTVLGEGGFGKVYKGWLDEKANSRNGSGTVVAIKRLMGYCWEETELLLVYEFMQKGSLENHLFGRGSAAQPLPWDLRIKVLIGAARGLAFLHTSEKQVIYRDFKASNILLDGSYNAKISDFGLAKMGPSASQSHVTTRVMGTYGYAAPEYVATGHLYVKSDVYGFGVVLVEMLTGLRALDTNRPSGQHTLVDWIKPILADRRKLKNIMDSRLEGKYPSKASVHIAQLALTCLGPEPKTRPPMKEVVETLERVGAVNERPRRPRVSSSHNSTYRIGQQPLHQRSPLRSRQDVSGGLSRQQGAASPVNSTVFKQNQRREASGRIIRSILQNRVARPSPSSSVVHYEPQIQTSNQEKDKRPRRPPNSQMSAKDMNGMSEWMKTQP